MGNGKTNFKKSTLLNCRCGVHMVQMSLQLTGNQGVKLDFKNCLLDKILVSSQPT